MNNEYYEVTIVQKDVIGLRADSFEDANRKAVQALSGHFTPSFRMGYPFQINIEVKREWK